MHSNISQSQNKRSFSYSHCGLARLTCQIIVCVAEGSHCTKLLFKIWHLGEGMLGIVSTVCILFLVVLVEIFQGRATIANLYLLHQWECTFRLLLTCVGSGSYSHSKYALSDWLCVFPQVLHRSSHAIMLMGVEEVRSVVWATLVTAALEGAYHFVMVVGLVNNALVSSYR